MQRIRLSGLLQDMIRFTKNEKAIIRTIDTLMRAPEFKRLTNTAYFYRAGYKNVGNFEIGPWYNWVTANGWEGSDEV
jgi:hypothetical protein